MTSEDKDILNYCIEHVLEPTFIEVLSIIYVKYRMLPDLYKACSSRDFKFDKEFYEEFSIKCHDEARMLYSNVSYVLSGYLDSFSICVGRDTMSDICKELFLVCLRNDIYSIMELFNKFMERVSSISCIYSNPNLASMFAFVNSMIACKSSDYAYDIVVDESDVRVHDCIMTACSKYSYLNFIGYLDELSLLGVFNTIIKSM